MPEVDFSKMQSFPSASALRTWLSQNHATSTEQWVKVYKKGSGIASVTWEEIVVECLCWGWIDGIKKSLDKQAYVQRITPRKPGSVWSKRNTEHVERLLAKGRMQESGLVHVRAAKADGRWQNAYSVSEVSVPEDFLQALERDSDAKVFYTALPKSSKATIAHGLNNAKKPETRKKRFDRYLEQLQQNEKPN